MAGIFNNRIFNNAIFNTDAVATAQPLDGVVGVVLPEDRALHVRCTVGTVVRGTVCCVATAVEAAAAKTQRSVLKRNRLSKARVSSTSTLRAAVQCSAQARTHGTVCKLVTANTLQPAGHVGGILDDPDLIEFMQLVAKAA